MTTLDDLLNAGEARERARESGRQLASAIGTALYRVGWLLAKLVLLVLAVVGGIFYGIGWIARRALWPALVWCAAAVKLGWEDGRRGEGRRVAG